MNQLIPRVSAPFFVSQCQKPCHRLRLRRARMVLTSLIAQAPAGSFLLEPYVLLADCFLLSWLWVSSVAERLRAVWCWGWWCHCFCVAGNGFTKEGINLFPWSVFRQIFYRACIKNGLKLIGREERVEDLNEQCCQGWMCLLLQLMDLRKFGGTRNDQREWKNAVMLSGIFQSCSEQGTRCARIFSKSFTNRFMLYFHTFLYLQDSSSSNLSTPMGATVVNFFVVNTYSWIFHEVKQ